MITVWRIALDPTRGPAPDQLSTLSDFERERAAKFATATLRNRWLTAHLAMRRILARALGVEPGGIIYGTGPQGKPSVVHPTGRGLEFNLSDSGDLALLALSRDGPVGVDVEECRTQPDCDGIAERFFAAEELGALRALPAAQRTNAFYRIWTLKEAYIKAVGEGLSHALNRFAVSLDDERGIIHIDGDRAAAARWTLRTVTVPEGFMAATAVRKPRSGLVVHDWPPHSARID